MDVKRISIDFGAKIVNQRNKKKEEKNRFLLYRIAFTCYAHRYIANVQVVCFFLLLFGEWIFDLDHVLIVCIWYTARMLEKMMVGRSGIYLEHFTNFIFTHSIFHVSLAN